MNAGLNDEQITIQKLLLMKLRQLQNESSK